MSEIHMSTRGIRTWLDRGYPVGRPRGSRLCHCRRSWLNISAAHYEPMGDDSATVVLDEPSSICRVCGFMLLAGCDLSNDVGHEAPGSYTYAETGPLRCLACSSFADLQSEKLVNTPPIFYEREHAGRVIDLKWFAVCRLCGEREWLSTEYNVGENDA